MDSLQKIIPKSSNAKGMLSGAIYSYRASKDRRWKTGVFPGGLIYGVGNAPWKKYLRSAAFNFQPNRFLTKITLGYPVRKACCPVRFLVTEL